MKVRLCADYAPWPLWAPTGLLGEDDLPLSADVKQRLRAWLNAYDSTHADWPMWVPPPGSTDEEQAWVDEGSALRQLIADELGPDYEVKFET